MPSVNRSTTKAVVGSLLLTCMAAVISSIGPSCDSRSDPARTTLAGPTCIEPIEVGNGGKRVLTTPRICLPVLA